MAQNVQVVMLTETGGSTKVLQNGWVYWKTGGNVTVLRTDETGHLFREDKYNQCIGIESDPEPTKPWIYRTRFETALNTDVELYYSLGAKPIPNDRLNEIAGLFHARKIGFPPSWADQPAVCAKVSVNLYNAVAATPAVNVTIPAVKLQFTKPSQLSIWPLLWELIPDGTHDDGSAPTAAYYTDQLNQGAALWNGDALTVTDGGAAPAPAAAERPKERGLLVTGSIDAGATGVKLHLLDAKGAFIQLRANATSTAAVTEVDGKLDAASGGMKPFKAILYLSDASAAFGPVQIQATSAGLAPPITETHTVHLAGVQAGLVKDSKDGKTRGNPTTEADDKTVVDFVASQQPAKATLAAQTRARRMATYELETRTRPLSADVPTDVLQPEMPLWMAELQTVGITKDQLLDLMKRRKRQLVFNPEFMEFNLDWDLTLSWDGPDARVAHARRYLYKQSFTASQKAKIWLEKNNLLKGIGAKGEIANAFDPEPAAIAFPVAGRRKPQVVVSGITRAWGRESGRPARDTMLIEWQPKIAQGDKEILRGGDGRLLLKELKFDSVPIPRGLNSSNAGPVDPPAADPTIRSPRFRVIGTNPPKADVETLADALVQEYYDKHNTVASVTFLSLACWRDMVRRILIHESGKQFDTRALMSQVSWVSSDYYGLEKDMPIFGPPHGYGYGQHDNPKVTDDACWSYLENIRGSVKLLMGVDVGDKAHDAYNFISGHIPSPPDQRIRAVYQREIVRSYNGGTEFVWSGGAWKIQPSRPKRKQKPDGSWIANPELRYPNLLGTNVQYWTGTGTLESDFSWPIQFTSAMFGPETA